MPKQHIASLIPADLRDIFRKFWEKHPFELKIRGSRKTKLGDFRFDPVKGTFTITLNRDLSPQLFCITFLHEYAHLLVVVKFGRRSTPHGKEWKAEFSELLSLVQSHEIFRSEQQDAIRRIMKNPPASISSNPRNYRVFLPELGERESYVESISPGDLFAYKGKYYKLQEKVRTRAICKESKSGRKYFFPFTTQVELV
jgi:SprT protein